MATSNISGVVTSPSTSAVVTYAQYVVTVTPEVTAEVRRLLSDPEASADGLKSALSAAYPGLAGLAYYYMAQAAVCQLGTAVELLAAARWADTWNMRTGAHAPVGKMFARSALIDRGDYSFLLGSLVPRALPLLVQG